MSRGAGDWEVDVAAMAGSVNSQLRDIADLLPTSLWYNAEMTFDVFSRRGRDVECANRWANEKVFLDGR